MNVALRFLGVLSCVGFASCGGKTTPGESGAGGASVTSSTTGAGATGPSTTATSSSTVTTGSGATTVTTTSGGGSFDPSTPTCETVCMRFAGTGCPGINSNTCSGQCNQSRAEHPMCSPLLDDFLHCLANAPLFCNGSDLTAPSCNLLKDQFQQCTEPPIPPPFPPPIFDAGMGAACPSMPRMDGMVCSGGGSSVAASTSGSGPSQTQCQMVCVDQSRNTWTSDCVGSTCSCKLNGQELCRCTNPSGTCGATCCPFN